MTKNEVRASIRKKVAQMPEEKRIEEELRLCEKIANHPRFLAAKTVLAFYPLPDEIDITLLFQKFEEKKEFLLPVVHGEELLIRSYRKEQIAKGAFGILEPKGENFTDFSKIDLILVPGMAFDAQGHRLGRGRGYYDRFLSSPVLRSAYTIGLAYSVQKMSTLPTEAHDIPMDEVL